DGKGFETPPQNLQQKRFGGGLAGSHIKSKDFHMRRQRFSKTLIWASRSAGSWKTEIQPWLFRSASEKPPDRTPIMRRPAVRAAVASCGESPMTRTALLFGLPNWRMAALKISGAGFVFSASSEVVDFSMRSLIWAMVS